MNTCKVCQRTYNEHSCGFENDVCSMACFNWRNKEAKRQEDSAIDRMEAGISEAETDY